MNCTVVGNGDTVIFCPESVSLDAYLASEFKAEAYAQVERFCGHVVFDMRNITFVDSAGLGAILSVMRLVKSHQKRFVICNMTPQVRSLFELVRIHKILEICNSREEAQSLMVGV